MQPFIQRLHGSFGKVMLFMITLTRFNGTTIMLNENFIEIAEETPDTVVTMQNGHRYLVQEKLDDIIARSAEFRRLCAAECENTGDNV